MNQLKRILLFVLILALALSSMTSCGLIEKLGISIPGFGSNTDDTNNQDNNSDVNGGENKDELTKEELWAKEYDCITIAEALELCEKYVDSPSSERYYIIATVKSVDNATFGQLTITDATGEIMVYGTRNADGTVYYDAMDTQLQAGDVVLIYGDLQNYKGSTKEVHTAWLIDFYTPEKEPTDLSAYMQMTVDAARKADDGSLAKVTGVVARITYANGMKPSGFFLVDSTNSIYVYDGTAASSVKIGNTVTVAGEKDHWILDTEISNAEKYGYKGCNQLTNIILVDNDKGNTEFDKSWIPVSTVKAVIETPFTEDITTTIFKVNALVKKDVQPGFINFYIDDLDGVTGSYVYTQCSGDDLDWMNEFDGKICTVYLTAINAKSTGTGCNWRFIPVAIVNENFKFDLADAPEFAINYFGKAAIEDNYMVGAKVELPASVSSELLGFEGVTLSYTVSDSALANISEEDGVLYLNLNAAGKLTVTVKATYGELTAEETISVTVSSAAQFNTITIPEAIAAANGTEVTVKGIVGPSAVNQDGTFYLITAEGSIVVQGFNADEFMAGLSIGDEVIVKGTRSVTKDGKGQLLIDDCVILANYYGDHDYSTESFIKNMTIANIKAVTDTPEATTGVYVVTATVKKNVSQNGTYTNITFYVGDLQLYSGSAAQYAWLEDYFAEGETSRELTLELALCDWNGKGIKGCVLAVYNEDGTKTYNTWGF